MPSVSAARIRTWLAPPPTLVQWLRILGLILLGLIALSLLLFSIHRALLPIIAWILPSLRPKFWDLAVYGAYPTESYVSFDLQGPETSIVRWEESCDEGLVLVSPFGKSVPHDGPMILDARGDLIWTTKEFGTVMNFRMQKWQGKNHLTFWAGHKSGSLGEGAYFILDNTYEVVKKVHAVGETLKGDLHEFEITDGGTALITIYTKRQVDTRAMGMWRPEDGWIMDSMFQEIDIETGKLLFEWKASDHFRPEETFYTNPLGGRHFESFPFDFYHINSMQKDSLGNYLISARHLHTVSYINGETGAVEWTLGGDYTDFEDLSDGHATDFRWQHHAHWFSEEERILSLFDNQAAGPLHEDAAYSKGMLIQLDLDKMTATLLQTFVSLGQTRAASQGSLQHLDPNDHVLVGWGSSGAFTEFAMDGTALCETHLSAESTYWWERVKSYRAYKVFDWAPKPPYPPTAVVRGSTVYVSWNGATRVGHWELQGSDVDAPVDVEGSNLEGETETPEWEAVDLIPKQGFESSFPLPAEKTYKRYRVAALDGEKLYMRYSDPAETVPTTASRVLGVLFVLVLVVTCIACTWCGLKVWLRSRQGRHGKPTFRVRGSSGTWGLGNIGMVLRRRRKDYQYSKL